MKDGLSRIRNCDIYKFYLLYSSVLALVSRLRWYILYYTSTPFSFLPIIHAKYQNSDFLLSKQGKIENTIKY